MKSREELIRQQDQLLEAYEKVKDLLANYPNVVKVVIGIKETNGQLTEEGCIKVIVREKKDEADLAVNEIIPKEIEGIQTDIIIEEEKLPQGVCTEDQGNYRPIKGGIRINNYRNGASRSGSGTLGCLAQLNTDNSWVILSNHHVLYGDTGEDGDEIGQPWVGCCCCCKTNIIAENLNKNEPLDCAIAKVKSDIAIENLILEVGNIQGNATAAAVNGERVRKRGARTGFTSGTISAIDPVTGEVTVDPKASGGPANDPGGCTNYESGVTVFTYYGDSGSVYVNDNNEVVALHFAGNRDASKSYGKDIIQVQATLGITIKTTSSTPGRVPSVYASTDLFSENNASDLNEVWIKYIEQRLEATATGRRIKEMIEVHQEEVLHLVNHHRPVTVTWHRKQGPAFVAAFSRSLKHPEYDVPAEINRVSLQNLLMSMASILEEHGSEVLRSDLQKHALGVIQATRNCQTAEAFFDQVKQLDEAAKSQQSPMLIN